MQHNDKIHEIKMEDVNQMLLANAHYIKNAILSTEWDIFLGLGGKTYQDDSGKVFKLPHTAHKVVDFIDQASHNEINYLSAMLKIDETLAKKLQDEPNARYEYQTYLTIAELSSEMAVSMIKLMVEDEIKSVSERKLPPPINAISENDAAFISRLEQLNLTIKEGLSTPASRGDLLKNIIEDFNRFDDTRKAGEYVYRKTFNFFNKKILPFMQQLGNSNQPSEAVTDLNFILKSIAEDLFNDIDKKNVQCRVNALNETEFIIKGEKYNLTRIMRHEPDLRELHLNDPLLNEIFVFLKQDPPPIPLENFENFPIKDWQTMSADDFTAAMADHFKDKNNFEMCHPAHVLFMRQYTDDDYIYYNDFLRNKTFSPNMFVAASVDKNVQAARDRLEFRLRGAITHKPLTDEEMTNVINMTVMGCLVATMGLNLAKHLTYDPGIPVQFDKSHLSTTTARTVRGAAGGWVSGVKKDYEIAYEGGTPLYSDGFMSTSFDTKAAEAFMAEPEKMVSKVNAFDVLDNKASCGVDVSGISKFGHEAEYLYAPGSLMLVTPESDVKNPLSYGNIANKKVSVVITSGTSPVSQFYSSEINKKRNELVELYELLSRQNVQDDTLNEMKKSLLASIKQLDTQFKRFDVMIMKDPPYAANIQTLCGPADAVYAVTGDGRVYFLDKAGDSMQPLTISADQFNRMKDTLNLTVNLNQLTDPDKRVHSAINLAKLNYIQKITNHTGIENKHTLQESLDLFEASFNKVKAQYPELVAQHQQARPVQRAAAEVAPEIKPPAAEPVQTAVQPKKDDDAPKNHQSETHLLSTQSIFAKLHPPATENGPGQAPVPPPFPHGKTYNKK